MKMTISHCRRLGFGGGTRNDRAWSGSSRDSAGGNGRLLSVRQHAISDYMSGSCGMGSDGFG